MAVETDRQRSPAGIGIEFELKVDALRGRPEIVLLDNMSLDQLRTAVELRVAQAPGVLLEASGGITLETVAEVARTGVERISIGGLTHSAPALDLANDWNGRTVVGWSCWNREHRDSRFRVLSQRLTLPFVGMQIRSIRLQMAVVRQRPWKL